MPVFTRRMCLLVVWLWAALAVPAVRAAAPATSTFLYVPCNGTIRAYRAHQSGTLTGLPSLRLADYPVAVAAHPSGKFLYAATIDDQMHKGTVWALRVGPDGTLARMPGSTTRIKGSLGQIVVHPGGRLLYVTGEEGRILIFAISGDGSLRCLPETKVHGTFHIGGGIGSWGGAWLSFTGGGQLAYLYTSSGHTDVYVQGLQTYRVGRQGSLTARGAERVISSFIEKPPPTPPPASVELMPRRNLAALDSDDGTYFCPVLPSGALQYARAWGIKTPRGQPPYRKYLSLLEADPHGRFLYLGLTDIEETRGGNDRRFFVCRIGGRGQTSRPVPLRVNGVLLGSPHGRHLYTARPHLKPSANEYDRYDVSIHDLRLDGTVGPARPCMVTLPGVWDRQWFFVERRP